MASRAKNRNIFKSYNISLATGQSISYSCAWTQVSDPGPLGPRVLNICVLCIPLIFFEVGIPNLVCECVWGWWSVTYHFQVTVTLNRPSFKNNDIRSIYLTLSKVEIPNLVCGCILVWRSVVYHLRVTLNLTSDLVFKIILSGAYLLYYLREESQFRCADAG